MHPHPSPSSRPALLQWFLLSMLLGAIAVYVPVPAGWPEPPQVAELFDPRLLVVPDGDSYRFIGFGKHGDAPRVYAVSRLTTATQSVTRTLGWNNGRPSLGFFHLHAAWRFDLDATRFDSHWKSAAEGDMELSRTELVKLRPLVIAEMNRRDESRGERLKLLLDHGLTTDSFICWQNVIVALAWLSLAITLSKLTVKIARRFGRQPVPI